MRVRGKEAGRSREMIRSRLNGSPVNRAGFGIKLALNAIHYHHFSLLPNPSSYTIYSVGNEELLLLQFTNAFHSRGQPL